MKLATICFLIGITTLFSSCDAYRILGMFPFNGKSHNMVFEALMKGLAKRGHQVDVVTHFPLKKPLENYKEIINLSGTLETLMNNYTIEFVNQITGDIVKLIANKYGNDVCHLMGSKEMQNLIKNPPTDPPYDLVITEAFAAHCYMGLGYIFNVPVVAVSSASEYPWISDFIGNDDNPAYVPNYAHIGTKKLSYWERFENTVTNILETYKFQAITEESQTQSMRKYLRPDMPSVREVEKNVALTLVNSHPIIFGVKPVIPTLVQIAGLHIEETRDPLPPALQKWMDESKDGVVCFTLGSMVLIESMSEKLLYELYDSFKKIAPIRVLVKIVDESKLPPGLPKNVKAAPWLPQASVLAHPNTKMFITHGGLGGILEALHFGVPMIGMPLFADQFKNVAAFVEKDMMIRIKFKDLSGARLDAALKEILHNPLYSEKAKYYSRIFRDQPISPMDKAVFWIEYTIRNGANVLRPHALQFSWWQLALLDVYGLIMLVLILALVMIVFFVRMIMKKLTRQSYSSDIMKKKDK